jgi:hypothetical protein
MKTTNRNLGIVAVVIGIYGLSWLPWGEFIAAVGVLVLGIVLLTR